MTQIPNNSTVTYTAMVNHSQYVGFGTPSGLIADAKADLRPQGITVISFSSPDVGALVSLLGGSFTVNMQIHVENGLGFDSEEALRNVVDDAIEAQGRGIAVVSSDVLSVQSPVDAATGKAPAAQKTSVNADKPIAGNCISGQSTNLQGDFSLPCWFGNLTGKGLSTVGLLTIVAVLGVGLFVLSGGASLGTAVTTLSRRARRRAA